MADYKELTEVMVGGAKVLIDEFFGEEKSQAFVEAFKNTLFDEAEPRSLDLPVKPLQVFYKRLFDVYIEIESSRNSLLDTEVYLGRFQYRGTRVSKPAHLRYHIEHCLSELYILQLRLTDFTKYIWRAYRNDPRGDAIKKARVDLCEHVERGLREIIKLRGAHVHRVRYEHPDLGRLETLHLLDEHPWSDEAAPVFKQYYRLEYRRIRREWRDRMHGNNEEIARLLDYFADRVIECVGNPISPPSNLLPSTPNVPPIAN